MLLLYGLLISLGPNTNCPNRIVYIYTCYFEIWGTSGFCTWPYLIYHVHNPSWEYYLKTWVELSSLRGRYSVVYFQSSVSVSMETAISCLEACVEDIKIWITNNLLKLNDDKTELIVITTHSNTSQNQHIGINIGDSHYTHQWATKESWSFIWLYM